MSLSKFFAAIYPFLRPQGRILLLVCLVLVFEVLFNAAISFSLKYVIDDGVVQKNTSLLVNLIILLLGFWLIAALLGIWRDWLYSGLMADVVSSIRCTMLQRLQQYPIRFFMNFRVGDLMARFSGDIQTLEQFFSTVIAWAVIPLLDTVTHIGLLFFLDWRLALFVVFFSPVIIFGPRVLMPKAMQASISARQAEGVLLSNLQEMLSAQECIKAVNAEKFTFDQFSINNNFLALKNRRMSFLSALVDRSANAGALLMHVLVLGIGSYLITLGDLTVGEFVAFNALFITLSYSIMYVAQYMPTLIQAAGGMGRVCDLLQKSDRDVPSDLSLVELGSLEDQICFEHVYFSYEEERSSLSDISFSIGKGKKVAVVGPSGSGKSTLLKLLLGLFNPDFGKILYDGQDIRQVAPESLRQRIGVVFQETVIFNISLKENIRFGYGKATDADIERAARAAEVHEFISSLSEGYDSSAGERGGKLSGGQRQRISLARALLRMPDVLVLDEATAALDPVTEAAIYTTLDKLVSHVTLINITHRIHSIRDYDLILVMDHGVLREAGTHAELLAKRGLYSELLAHPEN